MQKKKKSIKNWDNNLDKKLTELLSLTKEQIDIYQKQHTAEIKENIEANIKKIKDILINIENVLDITDIYGKDLYLNTEKMISYLNENEGQSFKKEIQGIINKRIQEIKQTSQKVQKEEIRIITAQTDEIEWYIKQIEGILAELDDIDVITQFKNEDFLVSKIKNLLSSIQSPEADKLSSKLANIFEKKINTLQAEQEKLRWTRSNLDSYGIDSTLYYNEDWTETVTWRIEWKTQQDWKISLVVKLINWETHEYDKSLYLKDFEKYGDVMIRDWNIKFDMTLEEFTQYSRILSKWKTCWKKEVQWLQEKIQQEQNMEIKKQLSNNLKEKKQYYKDVRYTELLVNRLIKQQKLNPRSKVPPFNPDYIVLDEEQNIFKTLSARLLDQKKNHQGIEILEWWPWLWKTVMCEFLAEVTNREIVRVQCSKMDPSDMFFAPTLKKWETSREPADWIKLMQKPWTMILFDAIDKLNSQCFERLHSLFDSSRSVYDPQLWAIKANSDCLFLWTRNSYDKLSNPILSRSRILFINYPWELNEAYKISKYTDNALLKTLSFEEFKPLYENFLGTYNPQHPIQSSFWKKGSQELYNTFSHIKTLLTTFTTLRNQYGSDNPFLLELSYRDARQIFVEYAQVQDIKVAMKNILVPKAWWTTIDPYEKQEQENMVIRAIDAL